VTRAFRVAYFFHTPPPVVLALDVAGLLEWEGQAHAIAASWRADRPE